MALELVTETRSLLFCCDDVKVIEEINQDLRVIIEKLRLTCPVLGDLNSKSRTKSRRKKTTKGRNENVIVETHPIQTSDEIDKGLCFYAVNFSYSFDHKMLGSENICMLIRGFLKIIGFKIVTFV